MPGGVRAPGTPGSARPRALRRGPHAALVGQRAHQADVGGGEGVGLAQRAQGDVLRGPLADAGSARRRDRLSSAALGRTAADRRRPRAASAASAAARVRGMPSAARSAPASRGGGNTWVRPAAPGTGRRAARRSARPCRRVRRGADADLLAEDRADASSKPSQAPGTRSPAAAATSGASPDPSPGARRSPRVGGEVEHPAHAGDDRRQGAQLREADRHDEPVASRRPGD